LTYAYSEIVDAVDRGLIQQIQRDFPSDHSDRIGRECAAPGQKRFAGAVVEDSHELRRSCDGANGEATPDDLSENGEIRLDPVEGLSATTVDSKGNDLIQYK